MILTDRLKEDSNTAIVYSHTDVKSSHQGCLPNKGPQVTKPIEITFLFHRKSLRTLTLISTEQRMPG